MHWLRRWWRQFVEAQAAMDAAMAEAEEALWEAYVGHTEYIVKDSGQRQQFESGMQRDVTDGKVRYDLVFDGPMLERYAVHLTKGAQKYDPRNWMKAAGTEEMERFRESAVRHFFQWLRGDTDEDHAAAVFFNINGHEYVREKLNATGRAS